MGPNILAKLLIITFAVLSSCVLSTQILVLEIGQAECFDAPVAIRKVNSSIEGLSFSQLINLIQREFQFGREFTMALLAFIAFSPLLIAFSQSKSTKLDITYIGLVVALGFANLTLFSRSNVILDCHDKITEAGVSARSWLLFIFLANIGVVFVVERLFSKKA